LRVKKQTFIDLRSPAGIVGSATTDLLDSNFNKLKAGFSYGTKLGQEKFLVSAGVTVE